MIKKMRSSSIAFLYAFIFKLFNENLIEEHIVVLRFVSLVSQEIEIDKLVVTVASLTDVVYDSIIVWSDF